MELSNREIASLVWTVGLFGFAIIKAKAGKSLLEVIKASFAPKVAGSLMLMAAYTALCVWLLSLVWLWTWDNLKTTAIWAVAFAFVAMINGAQKKSHEHPVRWVVGETLSITVIVLFLADSFSFPLLVELILVPFVTLVALMQIVVEHEPRNAILKKPLAYLMGLFSVIIIGNALYGAVADFKEFATLNTAREFVVPVLLSFMFLPFLRTFTALTDYESVFTALSFRNTDKKLLAYAKRRALLSFRLDRDYLQRWRRAMVLNDPTDRAGVDAIFKELDEIKRRERRPSTLAPEDGWSPRVAAALLTDRELAARDYHRSFDEWFADSEIRHLPTGVFESTLTYATAGNMLAVTRLKLSLEARWPGDPAAADAVFYEAAATLLERLGVDEAASTLGELKAAEKGEVMLGNLRIGLARTDWGNEEFGGYGRRFVVCHPADNGQGDY